MYICGWDSLKLSGGRVVRKGDPVPEAKSWAEHIIRSNLRLGALIEVPDSPSEGATVLTGGSSPAANVTVSASASKPEARLGPGALPVQDKKKKKGAK